MNNIEEIKEVIEADKQKLTIVFDIDETLADSSSIDDEEKLYFLRKSTLIFAADIEHQVLPGAIELMQLLCSKDYINLAFFSSGAQVRNREFVKELLIQSLGQDRYLEVEPSIIILSKEDLIRRDNVREDQMHKMFGLCRGNHKKDISKALAKDGSLANAIFIDDDSSYIYYEQEKNFLRSPSGTSRYYRELKELSPDADCYEYRTKRLFLEFNTIFYIAGVLADCIDKFEKRHDLREFLFDMHFNQSTTNLFKFEPNCSCIKNEEYYLKGLSFLQTLNPNICFVSHEDYVNTLASPASEAEQQIIDDSKLRKTGNENCCLM